MVLLVSVSAQPPFLQRIKKKKFQQGRRSKDNPRKLTVLCSNTEMGTDSIILATAGYDHTIKFWQPHTGICSKTVPHPDSVSVF